MAAAPHLRDEGGERQSQQGEGRARGGEADRAQRLSGRDGLPVSLSEPARDAPAGAAAGGGGGAGTRASSQEPGTTRAAARE